MQDKTIVSKQIEKLHEQQKEISKKLEELNSKVDPIVETAPPNEPTYLDRLVSLKSTKSWIAILIIVVAILFIIQIIFVLFTF